MFLQKLSYFSSFLLIGGVLSLALPVQAQDSHGTPEFKFETRLEFVARVYISPRIDVGESKRGERRVVPITGGTFEGPDIRGEVLPGGEDWQLVRPDGVTELYARYLLRTDDGYVIQVINQVLSYTPPGGENYRRSVIDLEAPLDSPYDYLNKAIFLGTLDSPSVPAGEDRYVVISAYRVL
tara:strand:- start:41542 stop:42084 length:543 start_codon:yes stop_codon:yes gene_type:complete